MIPRSAGFQPALAALILLTAPAPAHAYSRVFYCFFAENSAELSDRCRSVAAAAAAEWRAARNGTLPSYLPAGSLPPPVTALAEIRGYATEAATPDANRALALRRATAVADELRRRGLPADLLRPVSYGDADALVPDTSHDPQNRRAWIILRPP